MVDRTMPIKISFISSSHRDYQAKERSLNQYSSQRFFEIAKKYSRNSNSLLIAKTQIQESTAKLSQANKSSKDILSIKNESGQKV